MPNLERIFVVPSSDYLCSARFSDTAYEDDEEGELRRHIRYWQDPGYLTDFYENHKHDLREDFYDHIDFLSFLDGTETALADLVQRIDRAVRANRPDALDALFRPLDNRQTERDRYQSLKARSYEPEGWLRLYALRTLDDAYIITGGAIKFTHRMDRPHLQVELDKMAECRRVLSRYIRTNNFYSLDALIST